MEMFGEYPTWLSDGRIVYKGCDLQGGCGLMVISGEGGTPQGITADPGDTAPASYDSKIAFMSHRDGDWEVYMVNADGSGLKRLTNNPANDGLPTWSPDGRLIAFISDRDGAWGVWVMNADGGDQRQLFALEGEYSPRSGQQWTTERIDWAP